MVNPGPYREGKANRAINERVEELADETGLTMAQIGIAWHLHEDWVDAPIVGVTSVEHVKQAAETGDVDLEEPYEPPPVVGHE